MRVPLQSLRNPQGKSPRNPQGVWWGMGLHGDSPGTGRGIPKGEFPFFSETWVDEKSLGSPQCWKRIIRSMATIVDTQRMGAILRETVVVWYELVIIWWRDYDIGYQVYILTTTMTNDEWLANGRSPSERTDPDTWWWVKRFTYDNSPYRVVIW